MTFDDKRKCSEIWEMLTGEHTQPNDWNPEAADALATMLAEVRQCSSAMSFVPKPSSSRPGLGWIVIYVYNVFKNRYATNKGQLFKICISSSGQLKRDVEMKLMGL
ncbi:MAG: hypothetical protein KKD44_07955 [Proteobacteria bacterium]|nr:hypothetical protein [Pseudomonadota bacterium]